MSTHPRPGQTMSQEEMMGCIDGRLAISQAGRVYAGPIAKVSATPRPVECNPVRDAVPQVPGHNLSVLGKSISRSAIEPATFPLQRRGEIPMIERHEGFNTLR